MGISLPSKLTSGAYNALLLAGTLHIAWTGVPLMRGGSTFSMHPDHRMRSALATFRRACSRA